MDKQILEVEQQVWLQAWCAVANTWNCDDKGAPRRWADRCLEDFRKTFPLNTSEKQE